MTAVAEEESSLGDVEYALQVDAIDGGTEVPFKAAIGFNGNLELVESVTPFRFEFRADKLCILLKSKSGTQRIGATLESLSGERPRVVGHFENVASGFIRGTLVGKEFGGSGDFF